MKTVQALKVLCYSVVNFIFERLCSFTIGFKFWKTSARKIFAISKDDLPCGSGIKRKGKYTPATIQISDNDDDYDSDDDFVTKPKKTCLSSELSKIKKDLGEINGNLKCLFKLSKTTTIPPGLFRLLGDTFQCKICKSTPIKPPAIYTRCCKNILGCQTCVDLWYSNDSYSKSCPICRCERAYTETSQMKGMDEFLVGVCPLLENDGSNTDGYID